MKSIIFEMVLEDLRINKKKINQKELKEIVQICEKVYARAIRIRQTNGKMG